MRNYFLLFALLFGTVVFTASCEDDDTPDPCDALNATYDGAVQGIINSSCAYTGCHNGTSLVIPEAATDFSTFAGMQASLTQELFETRVLDLRNMPPENVPPGMPTELTDAQLEILQCWADAGYPEN